MANDNPYTKSQKKFKPTKPTGPGPGIKKASAKVYTVKSGDNLTKIAKANGTTVAALKKMNPRLTSIAKYQGGNRIFSGTRIRLK